MILDPLKTVKGVSPVELAKMIFEITDVVGNVEHMVFDFLMSEVPLRMRYHFPRTVNGDNPPTWKTSGQEAVTREVAGAASNVQELHRVLGLSEERWLTEVKYSVAVLSLKAVITRIKA